jgi:hypothetical protein
MAADLVLAVMLRNSPEAVPTPPATAVQGSIAAKSARKGERRTMLAGLTG